ncbi:hypothetical protein BDV29DRAFT_166692, partial [Aspergillus leporis]
MPSCEGCLACEMAQVMRIYFTSYWRFVFLYIYVAHVKLAVTVTVESGYSKSLNQSY